MPEQYTLPSISAWMVSVIRSTFAVEHRAEKRAGFLSAVFAGLSPAADLWSVDPDQRYRHIPGNGDVDGVTVDDPDDLPRLEAGCSGIDAIVGRTRQE